MLTFAFTCAIKTTHATFRNTRLPHRHHREHRTRIARHQTEYSQCNQYIIFCARSGPRKLDNYTLFLLFTQ